MGAFKRILEGKAALAEVTNVIAKLSSIACALLALTGSLCAQTPAHSPGPAESLYLQLRSVGLDKNRVYNIRDASLDRASVHLSLDDGIIAFTQDAGGRITGAFFRGDGEVLIMPPTTAEQASLNLFTGAAILEERFSAAYLRFNDDVFDELKKFLQPAEEPDLFAKVWTPTAQELAQGDALRLLITFSKDSNRTQGAKGDQLLHAYLEGQKLGAFDVRYDSTLAEQVSVGQHRVIDGVNYYDVWLSFSPPTPGSAHVTGTRPVVPDFEITQFKIDAEIQPPKRLKAEADLTIVPQRAESRVLLFELSRLITVQSVEADGQPVEFIHNQALEGSQLARRGDDAVAVFLPTPLQIGKTLHLKFRYFGDVLSEAANGLLYVGEHGTWYPNVGLVMSMFDLEFRCPAGWTLVATGHQTGTKIEAGEQISHWVSERPVPVAGFNLGKYSSSVLQAGTVRVETYATRTVERNFPETAEKQPLLPVPDPSHNRPLVITPPEVPSPAANLQRVNSAAAQALEFYQKNFGPYPYSQLAITQFPGPVSQGWPGLIFLSSYSFLTPTELEHVIPDARDRLIGKQIIAHETAHQWWGDLITWNGYRDQWIMEALANYSALMLLESRDPIAAHEILQKYRDDLLAKDKDGIPLMNAGPVTLGLRLSSSKFPSAYEAISYGRGTWLLHMLRTMLRDSESPAERKKSSEEPFVRALRRLRNEYAGKSLTTAQLMAVFEAELPRSLCYEGHKSLNWFYDGWVNGSAVPKFQLRNVKLTERPGESIVTGTILQQDAPDTLVTAVPLYASVGGRNVFVRHVFADGPETSFRISAPAHTRKILLDPEQTLLSRVK